MPTAYELRYLKPSSRVLMRMTNKTRRRVRTAIRTVAADPFAPNNNVRSLRGGGYRLRVGDWRIIYELDSGTKTMTVTAVRQRGSAYRP